MFTRGWLFPTFFPQGTIFWPSALKYKRFLNTEQKLLIDKTSKKNSDIFTGRIDGGQLTHISKDNISVGDIVNVKIVDTTPFYLKAELL